jgi:hypothetical protein
VADNRESAEMPSRQVFEGLCVMEMDSGSPETVVSNNLSEMHVVES